MSLKKNVASQTIAYHVTIDGKYPISTNESSFLVADLGGTVTVDSTAAATAGTFAELDATNHPGVMTYTFTQAETNGGTVHFTPSYTGTMSGIAFEPAELEFITFPDWDTDLLGGTFATTTDSMKAIRAYYDANILTKIRSQVSVTEFSGTGWLSTLTEKIRRWTDEPVTAEKYGTAVLLPMIEEGIRQLFTDQLMIGDKPIFVRYNITVDEDVEEYILPPNVAHIYRVSQIDSDTGRPTAEILPSGPHDPFVGFRTEGNMIRLTAKKYFEGGDVYEVLYVPNGDIKPHRGKIKGMEDSDGVDKNGATGAQIITLPLDSEEAADLIDGTIDERPNAYGGYVLRVFGDGANARPEEIRTVSSYNAVTRKVTLTRPLTYIHVVGTDTYELVPAFEPIFEDVLALQVAIAMMASDRNKDGYKILTAEFAKKARSFRLLMAKSQMRMPSTFRRHSYDNTDYVIVGGMV